MHDVWTSSNLSCANILSCWISWGQEPQHIAGQKMVRRVLWADLSILACVFSLHSCIHTALASWAATFKTSYYDRSGSMSLLDKIFHFALGGLSDRSLNSLSHEQRSVSWAHPWCISTRSQSLCCYLGRHEAIEWYKLFGFWRCMRFMCVPVRMFIRVEQGAVIFLFLHCLWHVLDFRGIYY